ncbi:MAG: RNA polymerase factor sigma-54 [Ahrensia sp.]
MALNARLNIRQAQTMSVTPQLLQSIRLLQFTHLELSKFIDDQIEQNPLLEHGDRDQPSATEQNDSLDASVFDGSIDTVSTQSMQEAFDSSMENVFPDDNARAAIEQARQGPDMTTNLPFGINEHTGADIEDYIAGKVSLRDHVTEQIAFMVSTPQDRLIASELVDALDERGYIDVDIDEIAGRLACESEDVEAVLGALQECEPAGLFARNLAECLRIQCQRLDRLDPAMAALIDNLELLARRDFKTLRQLCAVDESDLLDMLGEIRTLDPHPGRAFDTAGSQAIIHDVVVTEASDGSWRIELNEEALPRVLVNRDYHATLSRNVGAGADKSFVSDCFANANWLERSLNQRAQTILKVATEIVKQQDAFFAEGVRSLKPMTMKAVADAIEMHESTVSRVASNKYMMTPRGLFELRYFFTVAISASGTSADGEAHSSEAVRQKIRDMIDAEDPRKVLSDDALVEMLNQQGIAIARRTVAKYREAMAISSSVQRRREKRARMLAAE